MEVRTVHLHDLDGYEFEKLCKDIFECLGYGRVEEQPLSGDGGKDLIIYGQQGKVIVECKHQPNNSIGRPVVQKLHSAVISDRASMGIVVTSGKFSPQAIEHARMLSPKIELVDASVLLDLASRAGISLVTEYGRQTIFAFNILSDPGIYGKMCSFIDSHVIAYPTKPTSTLRIKSKQIYLRPVYKVGYRVNADFSTTVGRIHSINKQGTFFIDGNDGAILREDLAGFFSNIPSAEIKSWAELSREVRGIKNAPFKFPISSVRGAAFEHIIKSNTTAVRYSGRNNQTYSKVCEPNRNHVFIDNITQMYVPEYAVSYTLATMDQSISFVHNGRPDLFVYSDTTNSCRYCSKPIAGKRHLCLECGTVSCGKKSFFKASSHTISCAICGKTICPDCARYTPKLLFLKTVVCSACGDNLGRQGKTIKKLKKKLK